MPFLTFTLLSENFMKAVLVEACYSLTTCKSAETGHTVKLLLLLQDKLRNFPKGLMQNKLESNRNSYAAEQKKQSKAPPIQSRQPFSICLYSMNYIMGFPESKEKGIRFKF